MALDTSQFDDFLQLVLDNVPAFVFWKDRDSRYLGCNTMYADALGLANLDEIVGKDDFELYSPDLAEKYQADDREVIETGESKLRYEERWSCKRCDKSDLWVETTKVPLKDREGNIIGVIGLYRDITLQKKEQEQIAAKLESQLDRITNGH